jgi:hypothetical protein
VHSHHNQFYLLRWDLANGLPRLALNYDLLVSASQVARISYHAWPTDFLNQITNKDITLSLLYVLLNLDFRGTCWWWLLFLDYFQSVELEDTYLKGKNTIDSCCCFKLNLGLQDFKLYGYFIFPSIFFLRKIWFLITNIIAHFFLSLSPLPFCVCAREREKQREGVSLYTHIDARWKQGPHTHK